MACGPREIDGHLILADHRGRLDVEHRVQPEGIREIYIAAREFKIISAERHLTAEQMDVPEKHGPVPGAAEPNGAINRNGRAGPFDTRSRVRMAFHLERQVLQERGTR